MALKRAQTPDLDVSLIRDDRFTTFSNFLVGANALARRL